VNGVHDMGGQHGHGSVVVEAQEPVFHERWEGRVYALMGLARARGLFNLDEMRRAIEQLPPARYLSSSYYERWLGAPEAGER
jgi:nitrile hydratase